MQNKEKDLLKSAHNEIITLRRQNELMGARLSGFDDAILLLRIIPSFPSTGMSPDVVYALEKQIASIEEDEKKDHAGYQQIW